MAAIALPRCRQFQFPLAGGTRSSDFNRLAAVKAPPKGHENQGFTEVFGEACALSSVVEHFLHTSTTSENGCAPNGGNPRNATCSTLSVSDEAPDVLSNAPRFVRLEPTLWRSTGTGELWFVGRVDGRVRWKALRTSDRRIGRLRAAMNAAEGLNGNHAIFIVEDGNIRRLPSAPVTPLRPSPLPTVRETPLAELLEKSVPAPIPQSAPPLAATRSPASEPTLRQIIERWRRGQDGRAAATLEKHDYTIKTLGRYLSLDQPVHAYTAQMIREAVAEARKRGLRARTINETVLRVLRNAFDLAVEENVISKNPVSSVKGERPQPIIRKQLTWEQAQQVLKDVQGRAQESYLQLKFMLFLGIGKAEAKGLTGGAVDWEHNRIRFVRKKTGAEFSVPIFRWAEDFVRELQPRFRHGQPVFDWRNPRKALITACTRCGVEPVTLVSLRRTLIIHLLEHGVDPRLVAQWQGHSDATLILKVYGKHINAAHERAELAKLAGSSESHSRRTDEANRADGEQFLQGRVVD